MAAVVSFWEQKLAVLFNVNTAGYFLAGRRINLIRLF
jgi:hypothetical protein